MSMYTMLDYVKVFSEDVTEKINFIPMTCVIMAYVGYGLGYGVIPSLIAAETMPVDVRSTAVGFFMMIEMLSSFLLSKMKPLLMDSLHMHGLFAMFSSKFELTQFVTFLYSCINRHRADGHNTDVKI